MKVRETRYSIIFIDKDESALAYYIVVIVTAAKSFIAPTPAEFCHVKNIEHDLLSKPH
jgi:hypothetical protein